MIVIPKGRQANRRQSRSRGLLYRAFSASITVAVVSLVFGATPQLVVTSVPGATLKAQTVERTVHLAPPGANDSRYVYVPFDVPPHAVRISVTYQYNRANETNTIDIGLFDARSTGSDTDPRGFRGWSGGRRSEFFVSRDEATPGYLRGEIPAGKWRIILGLYQVAPAGVDVSFKINIETEKNRSPGSAVAERRTSLASAASVKASGSDTPKPSPREVGGSGMPWWTGDLHMHTVHSDGNWTVAELINTARSNGLDFIVITDHNTASHHEDIDRLSKGLRQPLVLRGEEITTYGGHTNAWGLPSGTWIDFRTHPGDTSRISGIAARARRAGALISINHPFVLCGGCSWSYDAAARDFDAIEVWNGPWDFTDEPAVKMWDKILQSGRRITAIASSDSHRPDTAIGKPATHVAARVLSQSALLTAIRWGHVYLSNGADPVVVNFEAEVAAGKRPRGIVGDEIRLKAPGTVRFIISIEGTRSDAMVSLISNGQTIQNFPAKLDGRQMRFLEIDCRRDSYFRLEVRDGTKAMVALTNPIYVKIGRGQ